MNFDEKQIQVAKRASSAALIYQKHFLKKDVTSKEIENDYKALKLFLSNFAHERQGAPAAYREIAKKSISVIFKNGKQWHTPTHKDAAEAWEICKRIAKEEFNNINLNYKANPMNEDKGVLHLMASKNISNIFIFVRDGIREGKIHDVFNSIKSIRGIGEKITSYFIRDVACLTNLDENKISDSYLLQPIDTWINQAIRIIFSTVLRSLKDKQKSIVNLCSEAGVSAIEFNQGAWFLGSQIAKEYNKFERILLNQNSKEIIKEHIEYHERYLKEVKSLLNVL